MWVLGFVFVSKLGSALFKLEWPISKTNTTTKLDQSRSGKSRGGDPELYLPGAHKPTREACLLRWWETESQSTAVAKEKGGEFWNDRTRRRLEGRRLSPGSWWGKRG